MRKHQVRKAYSKDIEAKRTTRLFEFNIREFMSRLIVSRDLAFYPLWNLLNNTISIPKDEAESFFPNSFPVFHHPHHQIALKEFWTFSIAWNLQVLWVFLLQLPVPWK